MKKMVYISILCLLTGCSDFLKDKSQDLVVAKSVTDLDETLIGSGYLPSLQTTEYNSTECCSFLNFLDDDINGVQNFNATKTWDIMRSLIFGYTAWQMEVGRTYSKESLGRDDLTWRKIYARINAANIILDELPNVPQHTDQDRLDAIRIKGECFFLRAQLYLMLANLYGKAYAPLTADTTLGVPLKLTSYVVFDPDNEGQFQRDKLSANYRVVVGDLIQAIQCLTESPQSRPLHRASKEAATLLLSRVYLYMQDWDKARTMARSFLQQRNELTELANYSDFLLKEGSPEVLFSQGTLNIQNMLTGSGGDFCVSGDLYTLFDTMDYRRELFFRKSYHTDSIALNKKYEMGSVLSHVSDVFTLRTAEGYLNMAEACAMLNDAEANTWLNALRRSRIKNYVNKSYSGAGLIEQVRLERRKELCFEGHRWFDLRRYSVCEVAPYKKDITRFFPVYNTDNKMLFSYLDIFVLEADSPAYVFSIPKSVMDFDRGMIDNFRPRRECFRVITEPEEPEEEDK